MRSRFISIYVLPFCLALAILGCKPAAPPQGFTVQTNSCQADLTKVPVDCLANSLPLPIPNVIIGGAWQNDLVAAQGSVYDFGVDLPSNPTTSITTGSGASVFINNARASAIWKLNAYLPFYCGNQDYQGQVTVGNYNYDNYQTDSLSIYNLATQALNCAQSGFSSASRRFAVLGSLPGSLTLGASVSFSTQYGMPQLYVYDGTRTVVATETATSVASDGSTATFPFPSSLSESGYSLAVLNATGNPSLYAPIGINVLSLASSDSYPGGPFGVSVASQTNTITSQNICTRSQRTVSTENITIPVITMISSNQINVDGTYIDSRPGPTGVVTYASRPEFGLADNDDDCIVETSKFTGLTRAIVANSGDSSVSIVDLVQDTIISNITVGLQPVAVAVTSDSSVAYVANYGDNTITRIDLLSGSTSTSATLPGQPTTVSVTSAGAVWTGGVGFLAQLDGTSLAIGATQSTGSKTISGLSFSNSIGRLIATTTDSSGAVTSDHIDPASVVSAGSYTPLVSNTISSTIHYFVPNTNAQIDTFSAAVASSSLSPVQLGAPPLVVQDGWAVISATPTGFSVSDLASNQVLFSETTSSPIAAIAVDSKLNVAYVTLPDSNQVLSVPLPGIQ